MDQASGKVPADDSSDHDDRIKDFFARHGGPGARARREQTSPEGNQGWSEIYAADGYALRCDWSRLDSREEMRYSEHRSDGSTAE